MSFLFAKKVKKLVTPNAPKILNQQECMNTIEYDYEAFMRVENLLVQNLNIDQTQNENEYNFIENILNEIQKVQQFCQQQSQKQQYYEQVQQEYQELKATFENLRSNQKRIEQGYLDSLNELQQKNQQLEHLLVKHQSDENIQLKEQQGLMISLQDKIISLEEQLQHYEIQLKQKVEENNWLHQSKIQLEQQVKVFKSIQQQQLTDPLTIKSVANFQDIMLSTIRYDILSFLQPKEMLELRLINSYMYKSLTFDVRFFSSISQNEKVSLIKVIHQKNLMLEYFEKTARNMPEDVIKQSIIKYVCMQQQIAINLSDVLKNTSKIFQQQDQGSLFLIYEIIQFQYLFLNTLLANQKEISTKMEQRKSINVKKQPFYKNWNFMNKNKQKQDEVQNEDVDIDQVQETLDLLLPHCTYDKVSIEDIKDIKQERSSLLDGIKQKIQEINLELYNKVTDLSQDQDQLGVFIENLQLYFTQIYVHSIQLLKESKELEKLKNYLVSIIRQNVAKIVKLDGKLEDYQQEIFVHLQTKEFMQSQNKNLEKRILLADNQRIENIEKINNLEKIIKEQDCKSNELLQQKIQSDEKIKVLAKEIINLRQKYADLEKSHKYIVKNVHQTKLLFDKLNLDIS